MPGDFDFEQPRADRLSRPPRVRRERDDVRPARRERPNEKQVTTKKPASPILVVALVGGGMLLLAIAVTVVLVVRKATSEASPTTRDESNSVANASQPPRPAGTGLSAKDPDPVAGSPTPETVEKVKRATVRVRVQYNSGRGGSGTGFVEKKTGHVLTNAHVVGLVEPKDRGPRAIELVVNSGEGEGKEFTFGGRLIDFDKDADLALIQPTFAKVGARPVVPDGLTVPKSSAVALLQKLFVFGYPFGERLGTEITVSETSVSSLRKDQATGKLAHIQVKGGMNPGNSGGPVVDSRGNVIGVAVAGIQGTDINFAIPGEVVQEFLARKRK